MEHYFFYKVVFWGGEFKSDKLENDKIKIYWIFVWIISRTLKIEALLCCGQPQILFNSNILELMSLVFTNICQAGISSMDFLK